MFSENDLRDVPLGEKNVSRCPISLEIIEFKKFILYPERVIIEHAMLPKHIFSVLKIIKL